MKKAFFHVHFGIGDLFYTIGAIRYIAKLYDEVRIPFWYKHTLVFESLFHDLPHVKMIPSTSTTRVCYSYEEAKGCTLLLCGDFNVNRSTPICSEESPYPYCFYDDIEIPRSFMKDYFHIPRLEEYKQLWEQMPARYIFIHEEASKQKVDIFSKLNTDLLVLDPNKNHYTEGHPYYEKAQLTVNKPSPVWHMYIIENAEELHLVESCYISLAHQLDISRVKKKMGYLKRLGDSIATFGIFQRE
jgi:hypothetical protein